MTTIDRALMKTMMAEINGALAAVAAKHGVTITSGSARWALSGEEGTIKLEIGGGKLAEGGKSSREAKLEAGLEVHKRFHPNINFDATYKVNGFLCKIMGYNTRARKTPFIVEGSGKKFRMSEDDLKATLVK